MAEPKFTPGAALAAGWEKTKSNFPLMLGVAIIAMFFSVGPSWFFARSWQFGSSLLSLLLGVFVAIGLIKISLKIHDGKTTGLDEFFSLNFKQYLDYLWLTIVYSVMVFVGLVLLIVPGVILILKYQFCVYLLIDKKLKPFAALRQSGEMTKGHLGSLFVFWLAILLLTVIGALLFGLGLLITVPVVMLAQVYVYRRLS